MGCSSSTPNGYEHENPPTTERRPLLSDAQGRVTPNKRPPQEPDRSEKRGHEREGSRDHRRPPPLDLNKARRLSDDSDEDSGGETGISRRRAPKKTRKTASRSSSPRNANANGSMTTEQMALAIVLAAIEKEKGAIEDEEKKKASAMAAAMMAWVEEQLAQGKEVGRRPKNNFCFKCGAALHSQATFCPDCGVKVPREGETESWREREARLKRERDEKERKDEEERRARAVATFSGVGSNSSPALLVKSEKPRPAKLKDMRGLGLLGETEEQFRKRQNLERQESQQNLFGLDAELKNKEQQKLENEQYKKMVEDAMNWIEQILGDRGVGSFPDNLKSGRLLCGLINKFWPGLIPVVNDRPITLLERENIKAYLAACERVGVRKQDLFNISDLYEEKYLTGVILNIYALAVIIQRQSTFSGPKLANYA